MPNNSSQSTVLPNTTQNNSTLAQVLPNVIQNASHLPILNAYSRIQNNITNNRWLAPTNQYYHNVVKALSNNSPINNSDLIEYVAVSAPLHCIDGWAYLGRALDSHSKGDTSNAIHLGYYAELRAAMSILAVFGIGIFSDPHFSISNNSCNVIGRRTGRYGLTNIKTHAIVWPALRDLSVTSQFSDMLGRIIKPLDIKLEDWLYNWAPNIQISAISSGLLNDWGLDLNRLSDNATSDQSARNEVSYRPQIEQINNIGVEKTSEFLRTIWSLSDPSNNNPFNSLDLQILKKSLKLAFNSSRIKPRKTIPLPTYQKSIRKMLKNIGHPQSDTQLYDFLSDIVQPQYPSILIEASGVKNVGDQGQHVQVLSRAYLLLRIATGANSDLLNQTTLNKNNTEFWWKNLCEERGLWEFKNSSFEFSDLWDEINIALQTLQSYEASIVQNPVTYKEWRDKKPKEISLLGECERIGLWGLGLS